MLCIKVIPNFYGNNVRYKQKAENDWQWNYFLYGTAVLAPTLVSLVNHQPNNWGMPVGAIAEVHAVHPAELLAEAVVVVAEIKYFIV